ncbi:methylated-DNA--[protein]-cysteine S-methyltransferase [Photobacterium halotolerans]|uniref:Methylated-DNA--protein-cysteine methyltransferase n=1 Tax=Photobacterium halotolerans TaxID=265726 RepID=A0A7X4WNF4_9GAMM|nr:methylated-DNA--[protein]-cysteine S-methyltransferase [Photobacterium halotolerans]NAW65224.1 methylated-DNA--[protein]-cysteine S-methyltransferase [Photobacterium halotolerans]NAW85900.1 methylated-DNA--[protein]-cysteine S-methyltransferase [Photobacterium halotolerans]
MTSTTTRTVQRFRQRIDTPIGWLAVVADHQAITTIEFDAQPAPDDVSNAVTELGVQQLNEYFAGQRKHFDLPLSMPGTAFQREVWQALTDVPFGVTCSYSDVALQIARPKAVRAVGAANGKNPIPIVVPCHRIIGRSGTLTGYAGGLDKKRWLLEHEGLSIKA